MIGTVELQRLHSSSE